MRSAVDTKFTLSTGLKIMYRYMCSSFSAPSELIYLYVFKVLFDIIIQILITVFFVIVTAEE